MRQFTHWFDDFKENWMTHTRNYDNNDIVENIHIFERNRQMELCSVFHFNLQLFKSDFEVYVRFLFIFKNFRQEQKKKFVRLKGLSNQKSFSLEHIPLKLNTWHKIIHRGKLSLFIRICHRNGKTNWFTSKIMATTLLDSRFSFSIRSNVQ